MTAPEPRPWEIGPARPAVGFPWRSHRTLWDIAHGWREPETAHFVPVSSYAGQVVTEGEIGRIDGGGRDFAPKTQARRIPTRLLPPNPPARK